MVKCQVLSQASRAAGPGVLLLQTVHFRHHTAAEPPAGWTYWRRSTVWV